MPRKNVIIRDPHLRAYRTNYTADDVEKALDKILNNQKSIYSTAKKYKIPIGTLQNRYKGKHGKKVGRPTIFTEREDLIRLIFCSFILVIKAFIIILLLGSNGKRVFAFHATTSYLVGTYFFELPNLVLAW